MLCFPPGAARPLCVAGCLALWLTGCRGFLPDKVETVPVRRLSTSPGRLLPSRQANRVSLEGNALSVELTTERRCVLVHREQVRTTTTYKPEPAQRSKVLLGVTGTLLGGAILVSSMSGLNKCHGESGGFCSAFYVFPLLAGGAIFLPGAVGLGSHLLPLVPEPEVTYAEATSEEPGACGLEPRPGVAHELVFPGGYRLKGTTDAAGRSVFPVTSELAAELHAAGGRLTLWLEGLPSQRVDLSTSLAGLPPPGR